MIGYSDWVTCHVIGLVDLPIELAVSLHAHVVWTDDMGFEWLQQR